MGAWHGGGEAVKVAASLLGAGGGRRCTGGLDQAERLSGAGRFQGKGVRATRKMQAEM
jgi:hypothetical protein